MKRARNAIKDAVRQADDCSPRCESERVEMKQHTALMRDFLLQDETGEFQWPIEPAQRI